MNTLPFFRQLTIALACCASIFSSVALSAPVSRVTLDLAGTWEFSSDEGGSWSSTTVPVGFTWADQLRFRKKISVPADIRSGHVAVLSFDAIHNSAQIYFNEQLVAQHNGSSPFEVTIPSSIIGDENILVVVVDRTLDAKSSIPLVGEPRGWQNTGGILGPVSLVLRPDYHIVSASGASRDITFHQDGTGDAALGVNVTVGLSQFGSVGVFTTRCELLDAAGSVIATSGDEVTAVDQGRAVNVKCSIKPAAVKLWSPASPTLYQLRITALRNGAATDEIHQSVGFREFSSQEKNFLLNGAPVKLSGVTMSGALTGLSHEAITAEVLAIRALGANAVRIMHAPIPTFLLDECDRLGVMAIVDLPITAVPHHFMREDTYAVRAENFIRETIARDRWHPSIIAWTLATHSDFSGEAGKNFVSRLVTTINAVDSDRLHSVVSSLFGSTPFIDNVDFICAVASSDNADVARIANEWNARAPHMPVVIGEFGKAVQVGNHNGYSDPFSEEAQAKFLYDGYLSLRNVPTAGVFVHSLNDWISDVPVVAAGNSRYARLVSIGLRTLSREKRLSFDIIKALFNNEKVPMIHIGDASTSSPMMMTIMGVILVLAFVALANMSRRFRENVGRAMFRVYNFFADVRDHRIISVLEVVAVGVFVAGGYALAIESILYHFRSSQAAEFILMNVFRNRWVAESMVAIVWSPVTGVLMLMIVFFLLGVILAGIIRIAAVFIRSRIFFLDAYAIVAWGALPGIIFIPFGMVGSKLLDGGTDVAMLALLILAVIVIWTIARISRGIAVLFDITPTRIHSVSALLLVAIVGGTMWYCQAKFSTLSYFQFFYHLYW